MLEDIRSAIEHRLGAQITGVGLRDERVDVVLARPGTLENALIEEFGDVFRFTYGTFHYAPRRGPSAP